MGDLTTAREALLAEALGDVARVADRLEAVIPVLNASRDSLSQAGADLADQLTSFELRMTAVAENAKGIAVRHIAKRTDELARGTCEAQVQVMRRAAMEVFKDELRPALQGMTRSIQHQPRQPRFPGWMTHSFVAILASSLSWALAAWLWFV